MKAATLPALACGAVLTVLAALAQADQQAEKAITNSLGMKLVRIEAGEFVMGAGDAPPRTREEWDGRDGDEAPAHKVKITKAFTWAPRKSPTPSTSSSTQGTRSCAASTAPVARTTSRS